GIGRLLGVQLRFELVQTRDQVLQVVAVAQYQQAQGQGADLGAGQRYAVGRDNRGQPVLVDLVGLFVHSTHFQQRQAAKGHRQQGNQREAEAGTQGNVEGAQKHG